LNSKSGTSPHFISPQFDEKLILQGGCAITSVKPQSVVWRLYGQVAGPPACVRVAFDEPKIECFSRKMPSCAPSAVLFDIDGTLVDDDRAVSLALSALHASHGHELGLSLEGLVARWKGSAESSFRTLPGG
jgi:hypothetical protein